jgi:hypothetical protein
VHHDEAYVYLRVDVGQLDWSRTRVVIGIDTYNTRLGDTRLPFAHTVSPVGLEFALALNGPDDARVLVDSPYNLYKFAPIVGSRPAVMQQIYNRPLFTALNADARYDTLWVTPNRRTIGRDGRVYEAQRIERNRLLHARQQETTLADWFSDASTGVIEVRIPWGMLHVTDPSSHQVLFGVRGTEPATTRTDGFRFVVDLQSRGDNRSLDVLPRAGTNIARPPVWTWPAWEVPRWYAERKPSFAAMREAFAAIPDAR